MPARSEKGPAPSSPSAPAQFVAIEKQQKLGLPDLDRQHDELFEAINRLFRATMDNLEPRKVEKLLASLRATVIFHFDTEETWMKEIWYPDYLAHKALHDDLTRRIIELEAEYGSGARVLSPSFMAELRDWVSHHVSDDDLRLAEYLRRKGF